jgi:hypothetical protein
MTTFEKFLAALVLLYLASHLALKFGKEAGVPVAMISIAETLVTA